MNQEINLIPPWKSPAEWQEIHQTLAHIISIKKKELTKAYEIAQEIHYRLDTIEDQMDDLCLQTCRICPDVCCLTASIWADFKDLVFLHLTKQPIPLKQNIPGINQICRYLGKNGCTLPRLSRPFLCTWYICPTQVSLLKTNSKNKPYSRLRDALQSIKTQRILMENSFVAAVL